MTMRIARGLMTWYFFFFFFCRKGKFGGVIVWFWDAFWNYVLVAADM